VEFTTPEHASNAFERFPGIVYNGYNMVPTLCTLEEAPCDPAIPPTVHNTSTARPGSSPDTAMAIDDNTDDDNDHEDPPFSQDFNQSLLILRQACPPQYQQDLEEAICTNKDAQELQALVYQWVTNATKPIRRSP
jgi:hypothetical protein